MHECLVLLLLLIKERKQNVRAKYDEWLIHCSISMINYTLEFFIGVESNMQAASISTTIRTRIPAQSRVGASFGCRIEI
jgi:hypothetical protein